MTVVTAPFPANDTVDELDNLELEEASELLDRAMFLIERDLTKGREWDYFQMDLRQHLRKWR